LIGRCIHRRRHGKEIAPTAIDGRNRRNQPMSELTPLSFPKNPGHGREDSSADAKREF
jgi:hypothetical protein